jgi:hypothetical protein
MQSRAILVAYGRQPEFSTLDAVSGEMSAENTSERVIVFPHDASRGPMTAVRNVLLQTSLNELRENGHYERYAQLIAPEALERLQGYLAPGWVPIEIAHEHYSACERLDLNSAQTDRLGTRIGDRLQQTLIVTRAKGTRDPEFDLWQVHPSLYRIWARLYQGGSVQITRLGPREALLEQTGFVLNRYAYYREAQVRAIAAGYAAVGTRFTRFDIERYEPSRDELEFRMAWL